MNYVQIRFTLCICFTTRFDNQKDTEIAFALEKCISSRINDLFGAALLPAVCLCIPADTFDFLLLFRSVCVPVCRFNLRLFLIRNWFACVCVQLVG